MESKVKVKIRGSLPFIPVSQLNLKVRLDDVRVGFFFLFSFWL